jgi:hypothetical protein
VTLYVSLARRIGRNRALRQIQRIWDAIRSAVSVNSGYPRVGVDVGVHDYIAITTFSPRGYARYGRRFVESFLTHWTIPLVAYYETERPSIDDPRLILRDLDRDEERTRFLARYDRPEFRGDAGDYATQAIRFCHKVFALTLPVPAATWCLWLDADVETFAPVTPAILKALCPEGSALSYLGRNEMAPETGFVAYRPDDPHVSTLLKRLRDFYTSGTVFELDVRKRHDAALFEMVRTLVPGEKQHNVSEGIPDTHVWPKTPLGGVTRHWKGRARKREAYGETVD